MTVLSIWAGKITAISLSVKFSLPLTVSIFSLINGRMEMDSLSHLLATRFPEGNYETISGFIMDRLGRIPKRRERMEYRGITFIIENADQKSIKEISVIFPSPIDKVVIK